MEFANPALLGWLGLAGVPLLIHLLARPRPQRVPFAAVRFLQATTEKSRRILRVKNLLLLLARMLVLAAFVLAVARPLGSGAATLDDAPARGPSVAVIVDDTLGLQYGERYAAVRAAATRVLEGLAPGVPAAVYFASGERTPYLLDHEGLRLEVLRASCTARFAELTGVLRRVLADARERELSEIHVVTDLAAVKWPVLPRDAVPAAHPPRVIVIDVAGDRSAAVNGAVLALALNPDAPRAGQQVEVRATVALGGAGSGAGGGGGGGGGAESRRV
ncbi:MAG: BatA domain-containing protein [Planctomycetes bacterium]|nr:BatA domain-containing protein [Planctomycetota bacterium]